MKLLNFFKKFYNIYIGIVFVLVVFMGPFVGFQFRRNYATDNIWIFVAAIFVGILFLAFVFWIRKKRTKFWEFLHSKKGFNWIVLLGTLIAFLGQLFVVSGAWFIAGWDTRDVIIPNEQMDNDYMSMYPNQLFLAGLFRRINFVLTTYFGFSFDNYYFTLVVMSALCVLFSILLVSFVAKKLANNFVGILTFILGTLFLSLSPWIMIPYSDTFAMICTCLVLFFYVCIDKNPVKWFLIFFVSIIGYFIKPTAIFVLCAILFVELMKFLIRLFKKDILITNKKIITNAVKLILVALAVVLAFLISDFVCDYGVKNQENRNFTATHYLMMGINLENRGAWNDDDVNFTRSFPDVESRQKANLKEFANRVNKYGPLWCSWIYINKTLTNYADGSFCWEAETPWCIENKGQNPIVWAIYGIDSADAHNDNNNVLAYVRQFIWICILAGCALMILNKRTKKGEYVICFSLLAISAFLMLFEPDPRYMLLYVPYMIVLAPWGWWLLLKNGTKVRKLSEKKFDDFCWRIKIKKSKHGK